MYALSKYIDFFNFMHLYFEACFYMRQLSIYYVKQSIIFDYIQCLTDLKCDYTLSEEFRKNHYLVGLLLQEVKMCMNEPKEVRRHAIHLLRNQIAKHSFDDRYTSKVSSFIHLHGKICINACVWNNYRYIYMHSDRFTCIYCCKVNLLQELDHVELILHLAMRHI